MSFHMTRGGDDLPKTLFVQDTLTSKHNAMLLKYGTKS